MYKAKTFVPKFDKTWFDFTANFGFLCNQKYFSTCKEAGSSLVETHNDVAQIIGEGNVELDLGGTKIDLFCKHTPDF